MALEHGVGLLVAPRTYDLLCLLHFYFFGMSGMSDSSSMSNSNLLQILHLGISATEFKIRKRAGGSDPRTPGGVWAAGLPHRVGSLPPQRVPFLRTPSPFLRSLSVFELSKCMLTFRNSFRNWLRNAHCSRFPFLVPAFRTDPLKKRTANAQKPRSEFHSGRRDSAVPDGGEFVIAECT